MKSTMDRSSACHMQLATDLMSSNCSHRSGPQIAVVTSAQRTGLRRIKRYDDGNWMWRHQTRGEWVWFSRPVLQIRESYSSVLHFILGFGEVFLTILCKHKSTCMPSECWALCDDISYTKVYIQLPKSVMTGRRRRMSLASLRFSSSSLTTHKRLRWNVIRLRSWCTWWNQTARMRSNWHSSLHLSRRFSDKHSLN